MQQKYYLGLINEEWRLMIECLNKLRNRLISEGRYTDAVDEVLIKVCHINRAVIFLTTLFLYRVCRTHRQISHRFYLQNTNTFVTYHNEK